MHLTMIHLLAARYETHLDVMWSRNHCDRDEDYEHFIRLWAEQEGVGPPPLSCCDMLVPGDWDDARVRQHVNAGVRMAQVMVATDELLGSVMLLRVPEALLDALRAHIPDNNVPSPTRH